MITGSYRSLKDVYRTLREVSPLVLLSRKLEISPQGLRQKCLGPQFFTEEERDKALEALRELQETLEGVRAAIEKMPTRI